nr:hypothetical protein [Tanacetum cinerariifolium]
MLQNQNPVRRWKQWLVLPVLSGLCFVVGHAASAQPVPAQSQAAPKLSEAAKKARHEELMHKLREAQHQDSLRTDGKFEPGTKQQFTVTNINKPGEIVVTVTRVKLNELDGRVTKDEVYKEQPYVGSATDSHVYTYVEQMPQLPGGGNVAAIIKQIQANLVYPAGERKEGRVFVIFTVSATGEVRDAKIIKGLSDSYDAATLAAVEKLPRFVPGQQAGQP